MRYCARLITFVVIFVAGFSLQACSKKSVSSAASNTAVAVEETIFNQSCVSCHLSGVAGAPRKGDSAEWKRRIDAKGMPAMVASVRDGMNAMPPMGMCNDCTDETFAAVIEWMAQASQ